MSQSKPLRTVHVISHTHWDREWYMPYEAHRVKLIETMDTLLRTFDEDPEFRSFYLDGQTIVLEDYLQIYPDKRELLKRLCAEGKLSAGPWYVLQDEFLTSGEANVRNLQIGHRDAAGFGPVSKLGYFPDSFGNMGQAAQLLAQAGIGTAVFGRGVKATGFNNRVGEEGSHESPYSELIWESPDGSRVLGILFANWYNNGMEIPTDPARAKDYWDHRLAMAEKYASTPHLLLMNGCDHQPVQTDLSEALRVARELYPDYRFVHSNFDDYVRAVRESVPAELSVAKGELRSQRTDGWFTLVNTASARVYIKQLNQKNQTLLEKVAEPLAAIAHRLGAPYPHALLQYAWKTLMQNHPHDSICGCSVDEVYREMKTRFAKSMEVAKAVAAECAKAVAAQADTTGFERFGEAAVPFVVFGTSGYGGAAVVGAEIEWGRRFFNQSEDPTAIAEEVRGRTHAEGYLVDAEGNRVEAVAEDLGVRFGYELPKDKFRQPYMARALRIAFEAADLPAMGYATFAWIPARTGAAGVSGMAGIAGAGGDAGVAGVSGGADAGRDAEVEANEALSPIAAARSSLASAPSTLENEYLKVTVAEDGGLTVLDKRSGQVYADLGHYEDVGDIGNEYIFFQPKGDVPITTKGRPADVRLVEDLPHRATIEIVRRLDVPKSADERLAREVATMVPFMERRAGRSSDTVPLVIATRVSLDRSGRGVRVRATFDNAALDHRLRVLLPTDVRADTHFADSIFEVAERATRPFPEWKNPSNCQHMQSFVDVHSDTEGRGLTVAGLGLNEYEVLEDGRNTIAVTLLRSVGELGDWGVFPTPEAQCLGPNEAEWMIVPHAGGSSRFAAYREAYRFPVPNTVVQTGLHAGELPPARRFLEWQGDGLAFSSLKANEERGDWVARWYNLAGDGASLEVSLGDSDAGGSVYASTILEAKGDILPTGPIPVGGHKIVTLGWES